MTSTTVGELVERLLSREHRGRFTLGGGTLSADGKGASWGGKKIMGLRNPDGPVAAELISSLQKEIDTYRAALEPCGDTKAAHMGEFAFNLTRVDEAGDEYSEKVYVPWTTIKEIMAAIRNYAALSNTGGHNG